MLTPEVAVAAQERDVGFINSSLKSLALHFQTYLSYLNVGALNDTF